MTAAGFYSIRDVSTLLEEKYDTIARRASRFRQRDPDTGLVRLEPDAETGVDRVVISIELVEKWKQSKTAATPGQRTARDHVVDERDLLQQTLNHKAIELQHLELTRRDERIAELESQLGAEKDRVKALSATIAAFGQTITDLAK